MFFFQSASWKRHGATRWRKERCMDSYRQQQITYLYTYIQPKQKWKTNTSNSQNLHLPPISRLLFSVEMATHSHARSIARALRKHAHSFDRCGPLARSNTGSPRFTDFPSLCACSESSLTNLIGCGLNLLCLQSHSKPECRWTWPEVAILGADQKERGLWGREVIVEKIKFPAYALLVWHAYRTRMQNVCACARSLFSK